MASAYFFSTFFAFILFYTRPIDTTSLFIFDDLVRKTKRPKLQFYTLPPQDSFTTRAEIYTGKPTAFLPNADGRIYDIGSSIFHFRPVHFASILNQNALAGGDRVA